MYAVSDWCRAVAKDRWAAQNRNLMAGPTSNNRKKKGAKHWALFALRWGVAAVGVWLVVRNMSLHDQALVVLNTATNRPQMVALDTGVQDTGVENAAVFPVIDPTGSGRIINVPRADVLNAPDVKKVDCRVGDVVASRFFARH